MTGSPTFAVTEVHSPKMTSCFIFPKNGLYNDCYECQSIELKECNQCCIVNLYFNSVYLHHKQQ